MNTDTCCSTPQARHDGPFLDPARATSTEKLVCVGENYAGGARAGSDETTNRRTADAGRATARAEGTRRGSGCAGSVWKTRRDRSQWQMLQC